MSYGQQVLHSYPPSIQVPLPPGWECKWDATTAKYFYIDHVNKKTQWNPPTSNRYAKAGASPHLAPAHPPPGTSSFPTGGSSYASSTLTSRTSSSQSESVNSDDESSSKGRSRGSSAATPVVANADIKRRLQLKFNANQTYQQQIINDVLVGCKNNEKEAEKRLEGMGFKLKSNNVTKPKIASPAPKSKTLTQAEKDTVTKPKTASPAPKSKALTQAEKDTVLRQAKVVIGSKYTAEEIKKCAEKHNYHMPAMLAEYRKAMADPTPPKTATAAASTPSPVDPFASSVPTHAKQTPATTPTPPPKVFVTNTPAAASSAKRAADDSNETWKSDSHSSHYVGAKSQMDRPRTRSSSESRSHLSIAGPSNSSNKSSRSGLAKGPRVKVRGHDQSLSQGSSLANIALYAKP